MKAWKEEEQAGKAAMMLCAVHMLLRGRKTQRHAMYADEIIREKDTYVCLNKVTKGKIRPCGKATWHGES
jgi:hypothetical protein